jgi:Uma2 family endonuclease
MVLEKEVKSALPRTLAEFINWEQPEDGFKYEWNDGELIKFTGMNKKQAFIYDYLLEKFIEKGYKKNATLISEYDVQLTGIQMRRPDIAYLTKEQLANGKRGIDEIPEFVIEIISASDNIERVEEKVTEYFKAGVRVLWHIFPEQKTVYIYTSRRTVTICIENDICSASPVLPDFEIGVDELLGV